MKKKILKVGSHALEHPVFSLIILFIVVTGGLNYSGFCFEKMRYLSNEELMRPVIADAIESSKIQVWKVMPDLTRRKIDTATATTPSFIDAYMAANKNCCVIVRADHDWDIVRVYEIPDSDSSFPDHDCDYKGDSRKLFLFRNIQHKSYRPGDIYMTPNIRLYHKKWLIEQLLNNCGRPTEGGLSCG